MKWIAMVVLGCSMTVFGQDAKVVALTADEAKQAKALFEEQQALTKRQDQFNDAIRHKYTTVENISQSGLLGGSSNNLKYVQIKQGWGNGFVFSEDYKFIVPKPDPSYSSTGRMFPYGCSQGMFSVTPASIQIPASKLLTSVLIKEN